MADALVQQALALADGDVRLAGSFLQEAVSILQRDPCAMVEAAQALALRGDSANQPAITTDDARADYLDMKDWNAAGTPVVGGWLHVGRCVLGYAFNEQRQCCDELVGEYVPINLCGEHLSLSKDFTTNTWRFYLPQARVKIHYHRQLMQDYYMDALIGFDVHHLRGRDANIVSDLVPYLQGPHRRNHGREGGRANRGRGRGPGGTKRKRPW